MRAYAFDIVRSQGISVHAVSGGGGRSRIASWMLASADAPTNVALGLRSFSDDYTARP